MNFVRRSIRFHYRWNLYNHWVLCVADVGKKYASPKLYRKAPVYRLQGRNGMTKAPPHIDWLSDTDQTVETACGRSVRVWELKHQDNEKVLSA
jgi:hypothetical protein